MVVFGKKLIVPAIAAFVALAALSCQSVQEPEPVSKTVSNGPALGDDDDLAGGWHNPQNAVPLPLGSMTVIAEGEGCSVNTVCTPSHNEVRIEVWEYSLTYNSHYASYCVPVIGGVAKVTYQFVGIASYFTVIVHGFEGGTMENILFDVQNPWGSNTIHLYRQCEATGGGGGGNGSGGGFTKG